MVTSIQRFSSKFQINKSVLLLILLSLFLFTPELSEAQCAMCRASLENNLSNGDLEVGAGINMGILYLFVTPYLAVGLVAWLWYRNSRRVARVS